MLRILYRSANSRWLQLTGSRRTRSATSPSSGGPAAIVEYWRRGWGRGTPPSRHGKLRRCFSPRGSAAQQCGASLQPNTCKQQQRIPQGSAHGALPFTCRHNMKRKPRRIVCRIFEFLRIICHMSCQLSYAVLLICSHLSDTTNPPYMPPKSNRKQTILLETKGGPDTERYVFALKWY